MTQSLYMQTCRRRQCCHRRAAAGDGGPTWATCRTQSTVWPAACSASRPTPFSSGTSRSTALWRTPTSGSAAQVRNRKGKLEMGYVKDQITTKTTNPKCRFYWYLIKVIDWRYSQSDRLCEAMPAPVTFSQFSSPPSPIPVWINILYSLEGGGVWGHTHRRGEGLRQMNICRQVPLLVNFRVWCLYLYLVHGLRIRFM